jgi:hypothetical protein
VDGRFSHLELSYGSNGAREYLLAEICKRLIQRPKKVTEKAKGKRKDKTIKSWDVSNKTQLRHLLRSHEQDRLMRDKNKVHTRDEDIKNI